LCALWHNLQRRHASSEGTPWTGEGSSAAILASIKFLCACARSFFGSSWFFMCLVATDAFADGDSSAGRLRPLGVCAAAAFAWPGRRGQPARVAKLQRAHASASASWQVSALLGGGRPRLGDLETRSHDLCQVPRGLLRFFGSSVKYDND